MKQYELFEIALPGQTPTEEWAQSDVTADFTVNGHTVTVKGFYAGDGIYKVRFLPMETGTYRWQIRGIVNGTGTEVCAAAESHGMVRAVGTHFEYSDGTPFYPFGTTVYALAHQTEETEEQTLASLAGAPFNKVRLCVFPKHYSYNAGEPRYYPFGKKEDGSWDVGKPDFGFWEHLEHRLAQLKDLGIQADLILFHPYDRWGFSRLSQAENRIYLSYAIRRLAAFPNLWWSLANEYDLCNYSKTLQDWEELEEYVAGEDPYHHLLSCHNFGREWDASSPNISHVSMQSRRLFSIPSWREKYGKPVVIDECCYEGNIPEDWGCISAKEMTARFWRAFAGGGYCTHGETFLDPDNILWWATGGTLKGESPARIAFLKEIVESLPGPLEPVAGPMDGLLLVNKEMAKAMLPMLPEETKIFAAAVLDIEPEDRRLWAALNHYWMGHVGEECYLIYYDQRTCARDTLHLPENCRYRVELIDTWEMSRETILEDAAGETAIELPGREGLAVLAVKIE